jgi:transcriptional regulator with XRE-family HTH domain
MTKYGERIALLREKQSLTQEELANKLGISRAALSHYETSRREPDYETMNKIASFFNVSIDYLLNRSNNPEVVMDPEVREFVDSLELSDENILEKFALKIDGRKLSSDEAKSFIAFVRAQRSLK